MEQNKYISNKRCFDKQGNRFSVFATEKQGKMEIFELKANKKDEFSRNVAELVYKAFQDEDFAKYALIDKEYYHPVIKLVDIPEGNTLEHTFRGYIKDNFFKKGRIVIKNEVEALYKGNELVILK